jgi:hypothetical protein
MPANRTSSGKDEVRVIFLYREFDRSGKVTFQVNEGGYAGIKPVGKTARTDPALAMEDLRAGSREILRTFAKQMVRSAQDKGKAPDRNGQKQTFGRLE